MSKNKIMTIYLNAFSLSIPDNVLSACSITYEQARLNILRANHQATHVFRRQGDSILIFSHNGQFPVSGTVKSVILKDNLGIFCFLVKDGIKRHLSSINRHPLGLSPIELISTKKEDDLLAKIIGDAYPFQMNVKYNIDVRVIRDKPYLVIDCSTKRTVCKNCLYFLEQGFDLVERNIVEQQDDGYMKLLGYVKKIEEETLYVVQSDGNISTIHSRNAYLQASRKNFDDYVLHTHGRQKDTIMEKLRVTISSFNGGENKKARIDALRRYFQSKGIALVNGNRVEIEEAENIQDMCGQLDKPVFVFNDNGETDWSEKGFAQYGPYTKRTFDHNDPAICVICALHDKGRVEQFVRKLLKGISGSKYFSNGLEGKFSLGTSRVEVFVTDTDDINGYKAAIETAIRKKSDDGGRWDLALVQVRQSFKKLNVRDNPYYLGKSLFFLHQVPVQDFTMELLTQSYYALGYSLNNMALACYAKMGGVPWLLKSSPTLSHELVVGIGSSNVGYEHEVGNQRIMGITTVFSGDGSYIVSNTSKAVMPNEYCSALTSVLSTTIQKIEKRMNWQKGDTIRLIFHASVKKFNKQEIKAVRTVVEKYRNYQVEYAFIKISEDNGLHLFDSSTASAQKGKLAPQRGKTFKLSKDEILVYLIGQRELRQVTDGHPRGVILNVHKDSTFKDIKYLSSQLYSFASHSWRSYFPNPMPVTISYSDLIARHLGWLNKLPGWNDSIMIGKIGQSQWFL